MTDLNTALEGRYRIERELGQGGMATVYLAHDVRHDRKVALKVLRPELAAVIGAERFLAEIKTTANLQHPHILPLFDSGLAGSVVFYVMPYVEGESLRDRLTRETQFGIDDAVRMVREVASALDYAHRHGVIHRDIKPENILVHDGQALVADFGIALAVSRSDGGSRMTETGLSLGTPHYMSPEQAMGERTIDARTDIYALGCVLYELLTGEPPFTGPTAQAIVAKVLSAEPEPVTTIRKTVPPHVVDAVHAAIQKLPADRFKSAAEFSAALDGRTGGRTDGQRSTTARAVRPVGPSARLPVAAAWIVAAIAVITAAAGWFRPKSPAPVSRFVVALPDSLALADEFGTRLALSPDGRQMVHLAGQERTRLWLRSFDQLESRPVAGTEGARNPAISPDASHVAYIAGAPRAIMVVSLSGGSATKVTDSLVDPGGMSWGPGGIYFDGHLEGDGIAVVRGSDGAPEVVTRADSARGETWHFQPDALPNGRGLFFTIAYGASVDRMEVAVLDLKTRTHRILGPGFSPRWAGSGHLLYVTKDGTLMAVPFDADRLEPRGEPAQVAGGIAIRSLGQTDLVVSPAGTIAYTAGEPVAEVRELAWVTREGKVTPIDTAWRGDFGRLSLSPDGRRLATSLNFGTGSHIWVKELDGGSATRLTFEGARNEQPSWSPDGKDIVFTHAPMSGNSVAFSGPADGSVAPTRLYGTTGRILATEYSSDGAWLILTVGADVYARRTRGDTSLVPLLTTPASERGASVSPDGRWLSYSSDESGQWEVYVRPFPDTRAAKRQVSTAGGYDSRWSADGRELFFESPDRQLMVASMRPGPAFSVAGTRALFSTAMFRRATFPFLMYDVHPDGRRFLMSRRLRPATAPDQLVIVENFFEELKRR